MAPLGGIFRPEPNLQTCKNGTVDAYVRNHKTLVFDGYMYMWYMCMCTTVFIYLFIYTSTNHVRGVGLMRICYATMQNKFGGKLPIIFLCI